MALRGDETTARTFLSVFPLVTPVVSDSDGVLARELGVRQMPLALLFNAHGRLITSRSGALLTALWPPVEAGGRADQIQAALE